jgi:hypothetical protein
MAKRFTAPPQDSTDEHGKLLAALKAEEAQAVGYETSAEVTKHTQALDRYFGKPYGNEIDGRSKITTREIYETVAWTVPDILDIFAAGGRICDLEADDEQAEPQIDERADYLNYVFFKDNQGVLLLHDFIFDCLLHPRGYADIEWDSEPSYSGWEEYQNLTEMEAYALLEDEATEIDPESIEETPIDVSEEFPEGVAYTLKARKKLRDGCCKVEVAPPEDMFVAGRATDMASARYKGRLLRWRRSVWKQKFKDHADKIEEYVPQDASEEVDERRQARFNDGQADTEWATAANKAAEELIGRKEYIWYADPDTTDDAVLLRVYRLGDLVLEVEEVDDDPFASASSHRVPHRLQGLSVPEILGDLQELKTYLTRSLVDGTMQANVPRMMAKNGVNLDDLLNLSHGAIIRTGDLNPGEAVQPLIMPDLSASTLKALEWSNQIIEQRSGVTRHAQGMDPDSLNHTAKGIQLIQNAANAVKRLLARLIAVGVEEMMTKIDRTVMRNQKNPRNVKLGKQWKRVDPRSWSPAMRVTVSVGLGTGAKDVQLAFLQMIQGDQMALVQAYGPDNPSVRMKHLHYTVTQKLRVMGYQMPDPFFGEPVNEDGSEWIPQPQASPEQQKLQAKMADDAQRLQMDQQRHGMEMWQRQQEDQRKHETAMLLASLKQWSADQDASRKDREAMLDQDREERQAGFEARLAARQQDFEERMALRSQAFEERLAARSVEIDGQVKKAKVKTNGSDANFGGKAG